MKLVIDVEGTGQYNVENMNSKQMGYTMIGIFNLIICIATIGIIVYGYILFYR